MYAAGGSLLTHRDEDLSWGLGVSLGCAAEFDCLPDTGGDQRVTICTGDIIVGEFGRMPHAVSVPPSTPPGWWKAVDSFGNKRRCNVLFRQALTEKQQRSLAEQRAVRSRTHAKRRRCARSPRGGAPVCVQLWPHNSMS
eukprot:3527718-Prymnesium_polylepis.1